MKTSDWTLDCSIGSGHRGGVASGAATRRRVFASGARAGGAALAAGGVLASCQVGGGMGGNLPAKELRSGIAATWVGYINNVPLSDEVNRLW